MHVTLPISEDPDERARDGRDPGRVQRLAHRGVRARGRPVEDSCADGRGYVEPTVYADTPEPASQSWPPDCSRVRPTRASSSA